MYVVDDIRQSAGGMPAIAFQTARRMATLGVDVEVLGLGTGGERTNEGVPTVELTQGGWWGYSGALVRELRRIFGKNPRETIVHIHGIWKAPQVVAARMAARRRIPFIVSDYGSLDPWFWTYRGIMHTLRKRVFWSAVAEPTYGAAAVVHGSTPRQREVLKDLFPSSHVVVLSPGIDLDFVDASLKNTDPAERGIKREVLFVGRLDPQKGLDLLVEAFARVRKNGRGWKLSIVGPEHTRVRAYGRTVEELVKELGIGADVDFVGPLYGAAKLQRYQRAWVLAAPSRIEAPGMINLEAAACWCPSITTTETGLMDWERGGGRLIPADPSALTHALDWALSWSVEERRVRGEASRSLMERVYSWDVLGPRWLELYQSVLH